MTLNWRARVFSAWRRMYRMRSTYDTMPTTRSPSSRTGTAPTPSSAKMESTWAIGAPMWTNIGSGVIASATGSWSASSVEKFGRLGTKAAPEVALGEHSRQAAVRRHDGKVTKPAGEERLCRVGQRCVQPEGHR